VVKSGTVSCAGICYGFPSNGSIDAVDTKIRFRFVECDKDDIELRYDVSRGKEIGEPIASKSDTGVVAIVIDVGL
jgi:hypothetical protein